MRTKYLMLGMTLNEYQTLIKDIYYDKDAKRGLARTFGWLVEEIGELSRAIRQEDKAAIKEELADCLAWLLSVASILEVDAESALAKYRDGCPKCHAKPCTCTE